MDDLLLSTLEALGYPVRLQGSLLPDEPYPNSFFTYWNDSADGTSYYSNNEGAILWAYSLNFYSTDPVLVSTKLLEAKVLLKGAGFIVSGGGYDVPSDEDTHTGRGISLLYRQEQ
jgi:hypothetical protein